MPHVEYDHSILLEFFRADVPGRTGYVVTFDAIHRVILACAPIEGDLTAAKAARAAFNGIALPSEAAVSILVECDFLGASALEGAMSALLPNARIEANGKPSAGYRRWAERRLSKLRLASSPSVATTRAG
jgi:hypothetical protein